MITGVVQDLAMNVRGLILQNQPNGFGMLYPGLQRGSHDFGTGFTTLDMYYVQCIVYLYLYNIYVYTSTQPFF